MSTTALHPIEQPARINWRGIFPSWAYSLDELKTTTSRKALRGVESTVFHTVRIPSYWARTARHAPSGIKVVAGEYGKWVFDADGRHAKHTSARGTHEAQDNYVELHDTHNKDVFNRLLFTASATALGVGKLPIPMPFGDHWLVLSAGGVPALWESFSSTMQLGVAGFAATFVPPVFGLIGKPISERITDSVRYSPKAIEISERFIVNALVGIMPALTKVITENPKAVQFYGEVQRDAKAKAWVATFALPHGFTARMLMEPRKQETFIANMPNVKRSQVELAGDEDPAVVHLTVLDKPLSEMATPIWPHLNDEWINTTEGFSAAYTVRREDVRISLDGTSVLVGGSPNTGKSQTDSLILAAHALDPLVDIPAMFQFKDTGDFDVFAPLAQRNIVGGSDTNLIACLEFLEQELALTEARGKLIRESPLCPKHSLTREAAAADERLRYRIIPIDEFQRLTLHPELGERAEYVLRALAELGRASGLRLVVSTQTPSAEALPTGVANSLTTRIAHHIKTREVNDRLLSSGSYAAGWRANELPGPKQGPGSAIIEGQGDENMRCRMYYLSPDDLQAIVQRGLALRGGEVEHFDLPIPRETIVDANAGFEYDTNLQFLVDVNTVIEGEKKVQIKQVHERLLEAYGPRYDRTDTAGIETMLKVNGIRILPQVHKKRNGDIDPETGEQKNTTLKGISVDEFRKVINR